MIKDSNSNPGIVFPLCLKQTIATFFSHIMTAIGGNSAGPGQLSPLNLNEMLCISSFFPPSSLVYDIT